MSSINRRKFLRQAAFGAAALSLPARVWAQAPGANSDIRVAVIGFNGRGKDHIKAYRAIPGVRLVALCDVDQKILNAGLDDAKKRGESVEGYTDLRKLLTNKNIDAVSIATPNHWHALATVWAVEAGKDVYVEKPVCHNIREGQKMIDWARRRDRIVQAGMQSRSSDSIKQAVAYVRENKLGKILVARGLCYKRRPSIGKTSGPQPVPPSIDYNLWTGPAPLTPPRRNTIHGTVHYDWHWFWSYGNGDLGNQGVHQMDIARWFLGERRLAPRILAVGGRLGYDDDGETPNTLVSFHDYHRAPLLFEVRGLPEKTGSDKMDKYHGASIGVLIECEDGHVLVSDDAIAKAFDKKGRLITRFEGGGNHFANFIAAVRSRKKEDLNADIIEGHLSAGLCHTANISYRLGAQRSPEEIRQAIKGDKELLPTFNRMAEHLAANDVDLMKTQMLLGAGLKLNPENEKFIGDKDANQMLSRQYRPPFQLP